MTVTPLASTADVEAALGRSLTSAEEPLAEFALDKASEAFRRESGQHFTSGASTVRLKVNGQRVYLAQHPVASVDSVVDDDGNAVDYEVDGQWLTVAEDSSTYVTVAYDHGGTVPDMVRLAVAEIAARNVRLDDDARRGFTQTSATAGPFNESGTYASWAVGGQVLLSPEDKSLARSYRPRVPMVRVMGAPTPQASTARFGY